MRHALKLHPHAPCRAATAIDVDVARPRAGVLTLSYLVTGTIGALRIAPAAAPARADELWRHTCFEAFVRASGEGYYEFNFAPSKQWAAYRFDGYRSGMRAAEDMDAPRLQARSGAVRYELEAELDLSRTNLAQAAPWRLGLSAVIEEANGDKSYWALAHAPGKADFHHADAFACVLLAQEQP